MTLFVLRRLASSLVLLVLVSIAVFALIGLLPGDPARAIAGPEATAVQLADVRARFHLDQPLPVQYWLWLTAALRLDLGVSRYTGQSITTALAAYFPVTLGLVGAASLLALLVGVPLGVLAGVWPRRLVDRAASLFAGLSLAVPSFVLAIVLLLAFGVRLQWLPILGYTPFFQSPLDWARHILLPALALAAFISAVVLRQLRAGMIDTLESRHILASWARGGTALTVIGRHGVRNGSLPALTAFGVQLAALLGGTVIVEQIFSIPGIGPYLLTAIRGRDLPVIQACILLFVLCQVTISLAVDIVYGFLNPKVRVGR